MKHVLPVWIILSLAVFAVLTSVRQSIYLGTGANSYEQFGWPGGWLTKNEYKTYVSHGTAPPQVDEHRVRWYVSDWSRFAGGALIAVMVPGLVLLAVRFGFKRSAQVPTSGSSQ